MRLLVGLFLSLLLISCGTTPTPPPAAGSLDIYFIDVEGGTTLVRWDSIELLKLCCFGPLQARVSQPRGINQLPSMNMSNSSTYQNIIDRKRGDESSEQRQKHPDPKQPTRESSFHDTRRVYLNQHFSGFHHCDA